MLAQNIQPVDADAQGEHRGHNALGSMDDASGMGDLSDLHYRDVPGAGQRLPH